MKTVKLFNINNIHEVYIVYKCTPRTVVHDVRAE
jgi:hypothetical protein